MKDMKQWGRSRAGRALTSLVVLAMTVALGPLLLLASETPVSAESPLPPSQHVAQKAPIVPPPKPSGPLSAPTANIATPGKHQKPSPISTATTANANAVDLKVLVLAADGTEADLGAIRQILDFLGIPYQVFQAAPVPASASTDRLLPMLSNGGTHGYFQAVILTTGTLGYTSGGTSVSALTTTEWNTLYTYEATFGVRQVTWYTYPNADYGFTGTPTGSSTPPAINVPFTANGQTVFGSYANTATPLSINNVFLYLAQPLADGKTTALLSDAAGNALVAIRTYPDGRQNLALTFDSNQYLTHDLVLAYGLVNWVTNGLFVGERHVYQLAQPDDFFIADDEWQPGTPCGTTTYTTSYRATNADVVAFVNWQNSVRGNATTAQARVEIPFNGVGATAGYVSGETSPTLVQSAMTNKAQFNWMSHTWDHADLNSASSAEANTEIVNNLNEATTLGLTTFSPDAIVTPGVTGLANPQFLQSAVSNGLKYTVTDASLPQYKNPSPNAGIYNSIQPSILMLPRHATNLYYNVSTPQEWLAEDNCLYPFGFFGYAATYQALLDRESSQLLTYLLQGDIDPLMFHQANMRQYDPAASPGKSLLSDLMDATYVKYNALFKLPIVNLTTDGIGTRMANRMQYNAAGVTATMIPSATGVSSLTLTAQRAAQIPVTGLTLTCGGCTQETYGGQTIKYATLTAGQSITLYNNAAVTTVNPASGPVAGGETATVYGAGFQAGATVKFGANSCTNVAVADSATLRCVVPAAAAAGAVNVVVTSGGQTATLTNGYTYLAGTIAPAPTGSGTIGITILPGESPMPAPRPGPVQTGGAQPTPAPIPVSR